MNIEEKLERNYRAKKINDMENALRAERFNAVMAMFQFIDNQNKILSEIKKEKRIRKKNLLTIKNEEKEREAQKRRTIDLFHQILRELHTIAVNNANLCATVSVLSHNEKGELLPGFVEGYINLDLLHGLCQSRNILLEILVNNVSQSCEFKFTVNPRYCLTYQDLEYMRVNNWNNLYYFYNNYAQNHKVYQKNR